MKLEISNKQAIVLYFAAKFYYNELCKCESISFYEMIATLKELLILLTPALGPDLNKGPTEQLKLFN